MVVQGEDQRLFLGGVQHRAVSIPGFAAPPRSVHCTGHKVGQERIGGVDVLDAAQSELLDQAVLQGLIGAFHPSLGLGAVGVDGLMSRVLRAGELGQLAFAVGAADPEDAVLVRVEGDRTPMVAQILAQAPHVGLGGLPLTKCRASSRPVASSMNTIRVHRGPRASNQAWGEPSICTNSPKQGRRGRR